MKWPRVLLVFEPHDQVADTGHAQVGSCTAVGIPSKDDLLKVTERKDFRIKATEE